MATDEHADDAPPPEVGDDAVSGAAPVEVTNTDPVPVEVTNADTPSDSSTESSDSAPADDTASEAPPAENDPPEDPVDTTVNADPVETSDVEATADDTNSPTGQLNEAGTPQSQLNLAPPMDDPSGSNIPAPNLRQPLADGADPAAGAASTTADSLDPALVDPVETAKARVEGRTSDASLRAADGPHIDEVPADINDGAKPSDGGPERYPFPQGGDVDVATVPDGTNAGEYYPELTIEDTVILQEHELVPDRLVGRRAFIIDAPRYLVPVDRKDEVWITVRTRDEVNATLNIPLAAVEVNRGSVDPTVRG